MHPLVHQQLLKTRRQFLGQSATGLGAAALAGLLTRDGLAAAPGDGLPPPSALTHFAPKAKKVIYLFMNGGPTHVDLFDWKPKLAQMHGQPTPESYLGGKRFSTMTSESKNKLMLAPLEPFKQHGKSGAWVSSLMPHTARIADELCFIKSMKTDAVNHAPAITFMLSGSQLPGRPTLGAWLSYGLGNANENLPAFVAMTSVSPGTSCGQIFYEHYWGPGFLPSKHQGVKFRGGDEPVLYLRDPSGMGAVVKRGMLDDLRMLNEEKLRETGDPEVATRIAQYEMGFRMQASVPELTDLSGESAAVLASYGPDVKRPGSFARNCLLARRLVERGCRCVQLMHAGWDQHTSLTTELYHQCRDTDQASAALVMDLKQRGLLEDTLVVWGGEFGRTPFIQGNLNDRPRWGRDHHPYAFTIWMAGAGVKPGLSYGETDDLGMGVAKDPVHVHDFQATLLHLLGFDHKRLTYRFQGRDFRLTDVHGDVVKGVLA